MIAPPASHDEATRAADEVCALLSRGAERGYIGEDVSQLAHALQCAWLARRAGAPPSLQIAALVHDVGHLCAPPTAGQMDGWGVADHESIGAAWLAARGFGEAVTEPVRLHVAAKRYLVATRPAYAARLSRASTETLRRQGGPMTTSECEAFEAHPAFGAILKVRAWDEQAKEPDREVDTLDTWRPVLVAVLTQEQPTS